MLTGRSIVYVMCEKLHKNLGIPYFGLLIEFDSIYFIFINQFGETIIR